MKDLIAVPMLCIIFYLWGISLGLVVSIFLDYALTSIIFIFSGSFNLLSEVGFDSFVINNNFFSQYNFIIDTELKGFDLLINSFIEFQYSHIGRWKMLGYCIAGTAGLISLGSVVDLIPGNEEMEGPDDWIIHVVTWTGLATVSPFFFSVFFGVWNLID